MKQMSTYYEWVFNWSQLMIGLCDRDRYGMIDGWLNQSHWSSVTDASMSSLCFDESRYGEDDCLTRIEKAVQIVGVKLGQLQD